jgi:endonuclease-8
MQESLHARRGERRVYRRAGRPCPRCGTTIASRGQGDDNRIAYWCPTCQPSNNLLQSPKGEGTVGQ